MVYFTGGCIGTTKEQLIQKYRYIQMVISKSNFDRFKVIIAQRTFLKKFNYVHLITFNVSIFLNVE